MKLTPAWLAWPHTQTLIAAFAGKAELRFVGGCVRDALLVRAVQDVDAATPLLPDAVIALLDDAHIRSIPTGIEHGTVTALVDGKPFEITTLRRDAACDGRHADVTFTGSWQEDAARRDFTMNALYLSPSGELFDYTGGEADTRAGRVRFIGDARARIQEDYLRILRLFRFHAHYGKTPLDEDALKACGELAHNIPSLSGERIQHEMLKLLAAPLVSPTLQAMQQCGVLAQVMGKKVELEVITTMERSASPSPLVGEGRGEGKPSTHEIVETAPSPLPLPQGERELVRLAALLDPADVQALTASWKLSNDLSKRLKHITEGARILHAGMTPAEQKKALRRMGRELFIQCATLRHAMDGSDISAMLQLADTWDIPHFPVTGKDLLALGIPEGKRMGELLAKLDEAWEMSDYTLTKEALLARVAATE